MIEALKQIDLVKVLEHCWGMEFKRSGQEYTALSPFRSESRPSFFVTRKPNGHWVFFDQGSGSKGSLIDAVMERDGHHDVSLAVYTAKEMVKAAGFSVESRNAEFGAKGDLEGLFSELRTKDTSKVRRYLARRGIGEPLIDRLIQDGTLAHNELRDTSYCCFAIRDREGILRGLYNRKIDGPDPREKFLLGKAYPFSLDWQELENADEIHICEGILDGLSIKELQEDARVIALPGVHYDLSQVGCVPEQTVLVVAFDQDAAGAAATARIRQQFASHEMKRFDLGDAHDVNELLCQSKPMKSPTSGGKLSLQERIKIALSDQPSRELAAQYGVHHSRICDIRNDAATILAEAWANRQPGRKPTPEPDPATTILDARLQELQKERDFLTMRTEWLELMVNQAERREQEARKEGCKKARNKVKKKRKMSKK